jgi:uncharacterized protein (DUF488 family)
LAEPEVQLALAEAADLAGRRPCALLCYEADASGCHRRIVAGRIAAATGCRVLDL